jgi:hypothetical protein
MAIHDVETYCENGIWKTRWRQVWQATGRTPRAG